MPRGTAPPPDLGPGYRWHRVPDPNSPPKDRAEFRHDEIMAQLAALKQLSERTANVATGTVVIIVAACLLVAALICAVA